jgi:hypothetical protein
LLKLISLRCFFNFIEGFFVCETNSKRRLLTLRTKDLGLFIIKCRPFLISTGGKLRTRLLGDITNGFLTGGSLFTCFKKIPCFDRLLKDGLCFDRLFIFRGAMLLDLKIKCQALARLILKISLFSCFVVLFKFLNFSFKDLKNFLRLLYGLNIIDERAKVDLIVTPVFLPVA